jgi:hypothetical protein
MRFVRALCCISFGAALAAACGGTAVVGNGEEAPDASTPGTGMSSGSSSGSGDDTTPSGPDASLGMTPGFNVMCTSAQACPRGEVCCASFSFTGGAGIDIACARTCSQGGFQVCATSAECARGQECTTSPLGVGMICQAPMTTPARRDAGAPDAGRRDGGATVDAGLVDAGAVDATAVADAATAEAGTIVADAAPPEASTVVADAAPEASTEAGDDAASAEGDATDDGDDAAPAEP